MADLILEIGMEELPADYLAPAAEQLAGDMKKLLDEKLIEFREITSFYTVRRFTVIIRGVAAAQKDLAFEKKGPRADIAFKGGALTDVGKKFLASNSAAEKDIKIKEEKGQKFFFLDIFQKGLPSEKVLSEFLPGIITGLRFPKSMIWDPSLVTFARPVRWLLCLLDRHEIHFDFGNIKSGMETRLHKFIHNNKNVRVKDADDYLKIMKDNGIILSQQERRDEILKKSAEALRGKKLRLIDDEVLLERLANSVESVTAMAGNFDERFLFLPEEVIITAMREHQRYFAVCTQEGKFTNSFVNIRDGGVENNDFIAKQHAKVLFSRLKDAEFFFQEDLKTPLEKNNEKLKEAIFISGLGTMYEKMERLRAMAGRSKEIFNFEDTVTLQEAAYLSKADLMTNMVGEKEYVGLRGFMGGVYLQKQKRDEKIWRAVAEHYLPNMVGDRLPTTAEGLLLSIIDKIDNIVGFYIAGFKPTGSKDPYAVRRQALNIIYIVLEKQLNVDLAFLIYEDSLAYKKQLGKDTDISEITEFFRQRQINYFKDKNIDYDIINAVASGKVMNMLDDFKKAGALSQARKTEKSFNDIAFAMSRVANIVPPKHEINSVNKGLFDTPEEGLLYSKFEAEKPAFVSMMSEKNYAGAFDMIASFKPAIDSYFEKVLVMDKNIDKKNNRLNTLSEIKNVFYTFADFSKLVIDRK
jgi:glycyl-tRNA synthetase beta chain